MSNFSTISNKFLVIRETLDERLRTYSPFLHYKLTHNVKPLNQFLNVQRVSLPKTFNDLKDRISNNSLYFGGNYLILIILIALIVLILTNFYLFLSILILLVGVSYLQTVQLQEIELEIFNKSIVLNKKVIYLVLLLVTIPVILLTGPISTLLQVLSYSLVVIGIHSSLLEGFQTETSFNESVV